MKRNWPLFLLPYRQAVDELIIKMRWLRKQFNFYNPHNPIEFVTGRVKPVASIKEKMKRRYISSERLSKDMEDIAGIRIICPFIEDVYLLVRILRKRTDMKIVEERDYIKNNKKSGYRSYHVVLDYSVQTIKGPKTILAEIQIRTMAMHFWSSIDHSLHYKQSNGFPDYLEKDLQKVARDSYYLDLEMSKIRDTLKKKR